MKRLISVFTKPWFLSLLGIVLLSAILWIEGPLLSFDGQAPLAESSTRLLLIAVLFVLWAVHLGWKILSARLANQRLMKAVAAESASTPGSLESAAELSLLSKQMQEALDTLRKARIQGSAKGQYLYRLPWYLFIGAPGSGKTTLLKHSGLQFPLADLLGKGAVGGVGGTRNCDWWFTDEAVLLDTAGRYTTQDSFAEVDKAAWTGFLQLLKKHRRRRPINGVIIALSLADLLQQDEAERIAQATAIRGRIKELHERLGICFPVYVMVTKCDLLAGFTEFFDHLGKEERAQVWGMTFPLSKGQALKGFAAEFRALESQLQARLLDRLQSERDISRRALLYGFPQQFAAIGEALGSLLNDIFPDSLYEQQVLLRGVYFTSGTQEGSPIDRVIGSIAGSFGLSYQSVALNEGSGRSYFITRLLKDVIFKESGLSGSDLKDEQRQRRWQWAVLSLLTLGSLALAASVITSYSRNTALIKEAAAQAELLGKMAEQPLDTRNLAALLELLNAARDLPNGYASRDSQPPLSMTFGLYQGGKLGAGAQAAYQRLLHEALLPQISRRMEEQLRPGSANSPEYLYQLLKVYLMLGDRSHFDAEAIRAWMAYDWERNLPELSAVQRSQLLDHLSALLEDRGSAPVQLDRSLISDTRLILARVPLADWIYQRVSKDLERARLTGFSITAVGGRNTLLVLTRRSGEPLTRGISGAYTQEGYRQFAESLKQALHESAQNSWVFAPQESINSPERLEQLQAAVEQLYFDDYIKQWDNLLADISIVPFANLDQAARVTNLLAAPDSPLRRLLQAAAQETTLEGVLNKPALPAAATAALDGIRDKLDAYKKKLESALTSAPEAKVAPSSTTPVDQHFDALHKLVEVTGAASPLDKVFGSLAQAAQYFDAAAAARPADTPPPPADILVGLTREAEGRPPLLAGILRDISAQGAGLGMDNERSRLNLLWLAGPAQFCKQAIAGRYPLIPAAAQDITPDDFGRFFGPDGVMDEFFRKNLAAYVNTTVNPWRATANSKLNLSKDLLADFQRAARIRDTFFVAGGKQASFRFELRPLNVDASITHFLLEIDGQSLAYAKDQSAPAASFQLPSGKGSGGVHFEVVSSAGSSVLSSEGPWSWLRMLSKARVEATAQGERYRVTFDVGGRKILLEMRASSVLNPFRREIIEQFRCRDRL